MNHKGEGLSVHLSFRGSDELNDSQLWLSISVIFSCKYATLWEGLSVCPSVSRSVGNAFSRRAETRRRATYAVYTNLFYLITMFCFYFIQLFLKAASCSSLVSESTISLCSELGGNDELFTHHVPVETFGDPIASEASFSIETSLGRSEEDGEDCRCFKMF